jgi:hypothetical protein
MKKQVKSENNGEGYESESYSAGGLCLGALDVSGDIISASHKVPNAIVLE